MKKPVLLFTTAFITTVALAQPRIKHQGVIGGNEDDQFSSMYLTKDGGLIVNGTSNSNISDQKTQNSRGNGDYWIVKLDSAGNIQWDKTIGGTDYDGLTDLQQTSDGGYILGGLSYSNKSGDKTENRKSKDSYSDYWIVKLDAAGSIEWDKAFGGTQTDFFESLQQTADGGYILGGASFSNKSHEKSQNSRGLIDYWIIKLDVAGNIQWDKTIGGNNTDFLRTLQQTSDGGYILGGESLSPISGEKTENGRGDTDYWIVKLNSNGKVQWDKTIGGSNEDACYAVSEIKKNHYVVGGYSYSGISGDRTGGNRGKVDKTADYWLVELEVCKAGQCICYTGTSQQIDCSVII
ncbi:hypothetical protein FC093_19715 [Ilyomonas limi]|uniref:T9SS C-terminal target domain-containing protein n=1 Tax=Ilyomonas limi TaxID=2575867 RepID=A0A4U3KWV8_9BACT|nr:hypothetical protein [Ilyomonas limi]TKK65547.1 hypothetical protein FC093_19715 [Ilyomonas limi]